MFRNLIPLLADRYHVIAPDFPGSASDAPDRRNSTTPSTTGRRRSTAAHRGIGLEALRDLRDDYGAPVGFRLALAHPERITAIISQNGNAYEEGLNEFWNPIKAYWKEPTPENRWALRAFLSPETTRWQYVHGVPDETAVAPDLHARSALLARPGNDEIQLDLFLDYASNVALYPKFQAFFRPSARRCWRCGARTTRSFPAGRAGPSGATSRPRFTSRHRAFRARNPCREIGAAIGAFPRQYVA